MGVFRVAGDLCGSHSRNAVMVVLSSAASSRSSEKLVPSAGGKTRDYSGKTDRMNGARAVEAKEGHVV
eukprot:gene31053-40391_t